MSRLKEIREGLEKLRIKIAPRLPQTTKGATKKDFFNIINHC